MTITYGVHGRIVELTLDDTVTFHHPIGEATQRLVPPPRRPAFNPRFERRRSFSSVGPHNEAPLLGIDPASTAALPLAVQALIDRERRASARRRMAPGRHRAANRPSLLARLFGRGSKGGA